MFLSKNTVGMTLPPQTILQPLLTPICVRIGICVRMAATRYLPPSSCWPHFRGGTVAYRFLLHMMDVPLKHLRLLFGMTRGT